MNGSVNKVILIGNLGRDPEVKKLENGATLASFSIATSENNHLHLFLEPLEHIKPRIDYWKQLYSF